MIRTILREWSPERLLCTIDPISLTGLATAVGGSSGILSGLGLAGAGAAAGAGLAEVTAAKAPPPPVLPSTPPPQQTPAPKASTNVGNQPTFIGAAQAPVASGQSGKSLLGQ